MKPIIKHFFFFIINGISTSEKGDKLRRFNQFVCVFLKKNYPTFTLGSLRKDVLQVFKMRPPHLYLWIVFDNTNLSSSLQSSE